MHTKYYDLNIYKDIIQKYNEISNITKIKYGAGVLVDDCALEASPSSPASWHLMALVLHRGHKDIRLGTSGHFFWLGGRHKSLTIVKQPALLYWSYRSGSQLTSSELSSLPRLSGANMS